MASISGGGEIFLKTHAKIFTTMTAATINLIIIMILTRVSRVAKECAYDRIIHKNLSHLKHDHPQHRDGKQCSLEQNVVWLRWYGTYN